MIGDVVRAFLRRRAAARELRRLRRLLEFERETTVRLHYRVAELVSALERVHACDEELPDEVATAVVIALRGLSSAVSRRSANQLALELVA